jgi:hypothetical protein
MMMRRRGCASVWMARVAVAGLGASAAAAWPLGSSSALTASSTHVSASTLLRKACAAVLDSSAFRAQGRLAEGKTKMSISVYFGSAGELINFTEHGDQTVRAVIDGPSTYIEGNGPFWQSVTKSRGAASLFAGRWINMTSDKKDAAGFTKNVNKRAILSNCGGGSPTYVGSATIDGVRVEKVHDASNDESDTYYVESGPTPYILRVSGSPSQKDSGNLFFSHYGVQPDTAAPAGAIPISQLAEQ